MMFGSIGNPWFTEQEKQKVSKPTFRMVTDAVALYLMENNKSPVYFNIETKQNQQETIFFIQNHKSSLNCYTKRLSL